MSCAVPLVKLAPAVEEPSSSSGPQTPSFLLQSRWQTLTLCHIIHAAQKLCIHTGEPVRVVCAHVWQPGKLVGALKPLQSNSCKNSTLVTPQRRNRTCLATISHPHTMTTITTVSTICAFWRLHRNHAHSPNTPCNRFRLVLILMQQTTNQQHQQRQATKCVAVQRLAMNPGDGTFCHDTTVLSSITSHKSPTGREGGKGCVEQNASNQHM